MDYHHPAGRKALTLRGGPNPIYHATTKSDKKRNWKQQPVMVTISIFFKAMYH
jgi:hypothetical protein